MESEINRICRKKARNIYGVNLPELLNKRLEWELEIIEKKALEKEFLSASKTVQEYEKDGFSAFVRGCGGNSFVAWLLGITEVNPTRPHYICQSCKHIIFGDRESCGVDLPDICCPKCGRTMKREGFNLPPEFFYGAEGEKECQFDMSFHSSELIMPNELQRKTGLNFRDIPLDDPETMHKIAQGKVSNIPEFSNPIFYKLLRYSEMPSFNDLIKISGLYHGSGVWENNGEELIKKGYPLKQIICTREDIMFCLLERDIERKVAFLIAEKVRRGIGLEPQDEKIMEKAGIPQWYISSCNKIEYLFPRAHLTSLVINSYRLAYYNTHFK